MTTKLQSFNVGLNLLGFQLGGTWAPDENERKAAWEMYIELVTRTSVVELGPEEGYLREGLYSLYSLFDTTRSILRKYGPEVAQPNEGGDLTFGHLAVGVLNYVLRPVLAKWHPLLEDYEATREPTTSRLEHEGRWEHNAKLREILQGVRKPLSDYADVLADVAGVVPFGGDHRAVN